MIQELTQRKKLIVSTLSIAVFCCLFLYLLQIGILSQVSQGVREKESERTAFQKDKLAFQKEGLGEVETKISSLDFVKADKVKYILVIEDYLVKGF